MVFLKRKNFLSLKMSMPMNVPDSQQRHSSTDSSTGTTGMGSSGNRNSLPSAWSYSPNEENGPNHWNYLFSQARGYRQSPVVISGSKAIFDPLLKRVRFTFDYRPDDCVRLENNGAGWSVGVRRKSESGFSVLDGSVFYRLHEIRCHWAQDGVVGSEHRLGKNDDFVGEIQIVHYNSKYGSYEDALAYKDGLAIFAVLLEEDSEDNPIFDPITERIPKIEYRNQAILIQQQQQPSSYGLDVKKFLPENLRFFWTYEGSLTYPPCNECVTWTVFRDTLPISHNQLEIFRSLNEDAYSMTDQGGPHDSKRKILNNVRPVQPLNHRILRSSFRRGGIFNYAWDEDM